MLSRSPQLAFSLGLVLLGTLASCSGGAGDPTDAGQVGVIDGAVERDSAVEPDALVEPDAMLGVPPADGQGIDLLFVIDNSNSMRDEQLSLAANFNRFVNVLQNIDGGLPDVHIGIVTTDLGAGPFNISGCQGNGDNGLLQNAPTGGGCNAPSDRYISDIAGANGTRIRNYQGSLAETFSCIAQVGVTGCGFERPLDAMVRALDGSNLANEGFLRPEALLAVVIISDEDDCSVVDPNMYDSSQSQDNINSVLGPLSSFRCFEFGVRCDPDTPREAGVRSNCSPRQNSPYMADIDVYSDFLKGLKDNPGNVVVAGIVGPSSPVSVSLNDGEPRLDPSCMNTAGDGDADPAVRLNGFLDQFPERNTATTICNDDLSAGLEGIAELLATIIDGQ